MEQPEIIQMTTGEPPSENFFVSEHLQRMPNIFSRGFLYLIITLLLVALTYSLLSKIDIIVESRTVAMPSSHTIKVLSDRHGYIEKIFISEGHVVKKDSPLFLIRSKEALTYMMKIEDINRLIPLKNEYYDKKISIIQNNILYWQGEVERLTTEFENTNRLFDKHLVSITEFNSIKSRLDQAQTEVQKLISEEKGTAIEKETTIQSLMSELEMNNKMLSIKAGSSRAGRNERESGNIIRAEHSGTISELYFRNTGEYVRDSDLLCTIIPSGPLYMDIKIANKDVGLIEQGMEIKYKFDAFPYIDYGTLQGKVIAISPSAIEDKDQSFNYRVQGTIDQTYFESKGRRYPIKPGMTATAELVTARKSIFSILFRKIKEQL